MFKLEDGNFIEAVLMMHDYGVSVCVSSQIGCNMGCSFCESGRLKKIRNLTAGEIVLQILTIEEDIKKRNPQIRYVTNYKYEYVESAESRRIREQNAKEEQNREKTSNELPNLLVIVKNDFLIKLKEKISKMKYEIEDKLNNYSLSNLKIFLQNLIENKKIKDIFVFYSKNESEKILNQSYINYNHFNILLVGKSGAGKSTLINGVFDFSENEGAKTGVGKLITLEYNEFISDKRKGLRIID